jgi:predicted dehydrogenase
MEQVRIGFIGAGGIASRHVGTLTGLPDAKIVAFADQDLGRAEGLASRVGGGAKAYGDLRPMLDSEQLDALYICVPPFVHGLAPEAPETAALERGLPFFVEKPLSVEYEVAESIARAVAERGLVTAVGYHWRYLDTTERAQEILSKNPARLALGYWLDATPPVGWWQREKMSGGQMVEQTTHIFDLARVLLGDVSRVYATGARTARDGFADIDVCDVSLATLDFASGAVGSMASTCLLKWGHRVGLHLFGDGLAIEMSDREIMVDVGQGRPIQPSQVDPVVLEDRDFLAAVRGLANRIRCPYGEALKTHRVTTLAARSVREGCALEV